MNTEVVMQTVHGRTLTLITAALLMGLASCHQVSQVGEATSSFVRGDLNIDEIYHPMSKVYDATLKAADDLDLRLVDVDEAPLESKIVARNANDDKIQIWLWRVEKDVTKIKIRIGLVGDETQSWAIYDQIQQNL